MRKTKPKANDSRVTNPHSFWPTPPEAVLPLLPHLKPQTFFIEPCAGAGDLVRALEKHGHALYWAGDIEPRHKDIQKLDALVACEHQSDGNGNALFADVIITNPPFSRHNHPLLFEMIRCFSAALPTWLLLPSTFKNNDYAGEFMAYCHKVQVIGRIKWVPDSAFNSTMDFDWYLFDQNAKFEGTKFYPKLPLIRGYRSVDVTAVWIDEAAALDRAGAL